MKAFSVFKEDSVQILTQRSRIPSNRPDDVVFPSGRSSVSNIRPDAHQCLETSNCQDCIRPNVMANRSATIKSSRRIQCSSASVGTTWQYRPDDIQCLTSIGFLLQDTVMGRWMQPSRRCVFPSGRCSP
jgi:hypothetical protein